MRILVTGGSGQLARALRENFPDHEMVLPAESLLDLGNPEAIRSVVADVRPDVLINAGAFTQVDRCEAERDVAMKINGVAVGWLADACETQSALLVQISTDYVFDGTGTRPYRESDPVNPRSVYGVSKLLGEKEAQRSSRHLIVRTAWLYDAWGKNFFLTMRGLASQGRPLRVVADQRGCPTSCRALARQVRAAIMGDWRGVVHATCAGDATWHDFAEEIFRQSGIQADLSPCTTADYPLPAPRPAYSVLDGGLRRDLGADLMPDWREALAEVIADANRN